MQAFDGVTSTLELERGAWPLDQAYDELEETGLPINYGFAVSWIDARMSVMGEQFDQLGTAEESGQVLARVEKGLQGGGLGIGLLPGYVPETNRAEYFAAAKLAADYDVPTFTHVRGKYLDEPEHVIDGYGEVIAAAVATGAHMHLCHLSSSATQLIPEVSQMILTAQAQGVRVTTETYPFGAGSTVLSAPFLRPESLPRLGITPSDIVYLKTGERPADGARLAEIQEQDPLGLAIIHYLDEADPVEADLIAQAVSFPDGIIASDAMPFTIDGEPYLEPAWPIPDTAVTHPRSVSTFSKAIGQYVRDLELLPLPDAIRRMTLLPAQLLEDVAPQMHNKGRISEGADADIVIFDADTISPRATFDNPRQPSTGVVHLIVNGEAVIAGADLYETARPGQPIRGDTK